MDEIDKIIEYFGGLEEKKILPELKAGADEHNRRLMDAANTLIIKGLPLEIINEKTGINMEWLRARQGGWI